MTPLAHSIALGVLSAAWGALLGQLQLTGLERSLRAYLEHGVRARVVALHLLRLVLVAAAFALVLPGGALALLSAFAGWLAARTLVLLRLRRQG